MFAAFSAIMCENGFRYTPCASPCPQTCRNIGDEPEPYCNDTQCVEGCFCPEGYVQKGQSSFSDRLKEINLKNIEKDLVSNIWG